MVHVRALFGFGEREGELAEVVGGHGGSWVRDVSITVDGTKVTANENIAEL